MEERVIDVLKEGKGPEKKVYIEVGGRRIGHIHLGNLRNGKPRRVFVEFDPISWKSGYIVDVVKYFFNDAHVVLDTFPRRKQ